MGGRPRHLRLGLRPAPDILPNGRIRLTHDGKRWCFWPECGDEPHAPQVVYRLNTAIFLASSFAHELIAPYPEDLGRSNNGHDQNHRQD